VSIFVPAFPSTVGGLPSFVPRELWREEMWRTADALRVQVEANPASISAVRQSLAPVEDEWWAEADAFRERPDRWAEVGRSWGQRAMGAMAACIS
jgi:hypothetical protein